MGCIQTSRPINNMYNKKDKLKESELEKIRETVINKESIDSIYTVIKKIKVVQDERYYLVKSIKLNIEYLMTVIKKETEKIPEYHYCLSNAKNIAHPNIISIIDIFEDEVNIYIINEIPKGKELFSSLKPNEYNEKVAGKIFSQIASALYYYHSRGYFHGFLRPEFINLEIEKKGLNNKISNNIYNVTLVNYGELINITGNYYKSYEKSIKINKPYYTAPEILKKKEVSEKIDIFALGVILYMLLCGKPPFNGNSNNSIINNILNNNWEFNNEFDEISSNSKDLITKMLNPNPDKRLSAKDILMHPLVILSKEEDLPISSNTIKNTITNLSNFSAKDALQIATMSFISNKLADTNQKNELKKIFKNFDENGDGVLSYEEFTIGYTKLYGKALSNLEMAKLIEEIDTDKSGKIEFNEFLTATFSKSKNLNEENLREAFNKFDTDNSGKLSIQELLTLFDNNEEYVNELLFKVDENNDGELDFDEFTKLMNIASENDEKRLKKEKKKDKKDKEKNKDEDNKDEDEKDKKKKKKDKEKKKK